MGTRNSAGFTIIETVLFLSVTGLLILGVLIGTGTAINNQRYRDATETFKNLLQEQYTALESVRNGRDNTWGCTPGAAEPLAGGDEIRGQSPCVIVGRYMQIREDEITIYTVLARQTSTTPATTDIRTLQTDYVYGISTAEVINKTMEWGTEIAWPASGASAQANTTPRSIGLLFLRSPSSGAVYTFTSNSIPAVNTVISPAAIKEMIVGGNAIPGQSARALCVKVNGLIKTGDTAVYIAPFAAGPSAVETRSNDTMHRLDGTGASQC